jgi:putative toxin-antitoxin system antitoxin component (TIGR02293 family)
MATELRVPVIPALPLANSFEMARVVEQGLPTDCVEELKDKGLTFTEIAQIVIPPRTLKHRKARGERLSAEETERFLRVVRVLELAERIFGNREKALDWLRAPDERMENRASLSLIGTEAGARLVEGQLWAIDEGMYT